jgi:formylglycine-generating enzyme required for sulfatase activity
VPEPKRPLRVFLCHAHSDRDAVHVLYTRLVEDGVDAWLDKEKILPGQDWELEIREAVRASDVVVVCLSCQFNAAGFRQKEVRIALDEADKQPGGEIFIIPARLEQCDPPESLRRWQWVDLFDPDGYVYLMRALRKRAEKIGAVLQAHKSRWPLATTPLPVSQKSIPVENLLVAGQPTEKKESLPQKTLLQNRKSKIRPAWIIALVALVVIVITIVWELPRLASWQLATLTTTTSVLALRTETPNSSPTAFLPQPPETCTPPVGWLPYVVQSGDTLENIATHYHISSSTLQQSNCMLTMELLPSEVIYVPPVPTQTPVPASTQNQVSCGRPNGWIIYIVQSGDTAYRLSLAYGISVAELQRANCMGNSTIINVGQAFYVPPWVPLTPSPTQLNTTTSTLGIGSTWTSPVDDVLMVFVPAGDFTMGMDASKALGLCNQLIGNCFFEWFKDEQPVSTVHVDAFWIDKTEVTNAMYAKCVQAGACQSPAQNDSSQNRQRYYGNSEYNDYPVVYMDWKMAKAYCSWAGRRLPTEAEWEKAARGTDTRIYPWGETITCNQANYFGCVGDTTQVGSYADGASPYGALDMSGNVVEWTSSLYKPYPYDASHEDLSAPTIRVQRGGAWYLGLGYAFTTFRAPILPGYLNLFGFRCARDATR